MVSTRRINGARSIAALAVASMLMTGCSAGSSEESDSKVLRVTMANHVWSDAIKKRVSEFEEANGVTVELATGTADQNSAAYNVKLNAGAEDLDVMMYRPLQEGLQFARNGWLLDLSEGVTSDAEYEWDDFQDSPVETVTYEDKVYGVPTVTERELLFYRKDLLEEAGLEVPTTFEDLEAAARELDNEDEGVFGYGARGQRTGAVTQYSGFLYSHGGDFIVDGKAAVNTPEAVEAYDLYGRLLRESGPLGVESMTTDQLVPLFQQGKLAMYIDAEVFWTSFVDPAASTVADNVGVAPLPAGPEGSRPYNVPSWGLAVNAKTSNPDLATEFVKWASSPDMVASLQGDGIFGARESAWADESLLADLPEDYAEALKISTETGVGYDRPLVVQVGRARDIVGGPIVASIQGQDVQEAADIAQEELEKFLVQDAEATSSQ
jgi:multiple sugar transport system substrate-binding protein